MITQNTLSTNSARKKWWVGTSFLLFALVLELWALLYDIPVFKIYLKSFYPSKTDSQGSDKPVAQLMTYRNQVHVQQPNDLVWDEVSDHQMLQSSQSILTLERSSAEVAFLDGTGLSIGENSLLQIQKNSDQLSSQNRIVIKLLRGTIRKAKGATQSQQILDIQMGQTSIQTDSDSELTITATPETLGQAQIQVHQGEVQIKSPTGTLSVSKNEEAQISIEPKNSVFAMPQKSNLFLKSPSPGQIFEAKWIDARTNSDGPPANPSDKALPSTASTLIPFILKTDLSSKNKRPIDLEVSRTVDFSLIDLNVSITPDDNSSGDIQKELEISTIGNEPILYYWRARLKAFENEPERLSSSSRFWIQPPAHQKSAQKNSSRVQLLKSTPLPPPSEIFKPKIESMDTKESP